MDDRRGPGDASPPNDRSTTGRYTHDVDNSTTGVGRSEPSEEGHSAAEPTPVELKSLHSVSDEPVAGTKNATAASTSAAGSEQPWETPVTAPSSSTQESNVEVLPPEHSADSGGRSLGADVDIEQTTVSIGLSGISIRRTRAAAAPLQRDMIAVNALPQAATKSATDPEPASDAGVSAATRDGDAASAPQMEDGVDLPEFETVRLLSRFLVGLALEGGDELLTRLRAIEEELLQEANGRQEPAPAADSVSLLRYLAVGTLLWGQQATLRSAFKGFETAARVTTRTVGLADKLTDNALLRPARRPVGWSSKRAAIFMKARISEGRNDEEQGRALATQAVAGIIDSFINSLSDNPEFTELISESGLSLAGTVVDNSRQVGVAADGMLENLVRRVFKRRARNELPQSPYVGKLQDMYTPENLVSQNDESRQPDSTNSSKE